MSDTAEVLWNNQGEWEPIGSFDKEKDYPKVVLDNQTNLPKRLKLGEHEYLSGSTYARMSEGLSRATEMLGSADEKASNAEKGQKAAEAERDQARKAVQSLSDMHAPNDDGFCEICDEISCETYVTAQGIMEAWEPKKDDEPEASDDEE